MNSDVLFKYFDRIAEAPDAVARLRQFVLDLAVRGKLVEQDLEDESAEVLLERIQIEHAKRAKEAGRRRRKPFAEVDLDELFFERPSLWGFVRLGSVLDMINGRAFKPTEWIESGLPIVRIQNLNNPQAPFNYCDSKTVDDRHLIDDDEFLISWSGTPGTSFGAFIWKRGPAALNQHIFRCIQIGDAFKPEFLQLAINNQLDVLIANAQGGVGLQHVTKGALEALILPLPPLAEQHRIVAKVDELMVLCDELETARNEREARRDRLVAASLHRLQTAPAIESEERDEADSALPLSAAARFHLDHLPRLGTRPEHIEQLRQTLLLLAVRGKLVEQSTEDEPAAELLRWIRNQKALLVDQGVIRKSRPLPPVTGDESPFPLPSAWSWTRLGEVIHLVSGQHLKPSEYSITETDCIPYITGPADFGPDGLVITRWALVRKAVATDGDLLLTVKGSGVGKTITCSLPVVAISRQLMALTAIGWDRRFLELVTYSLAERLRKSARSLIPGIARDDVEGFIMGMPPLAEQQRIVAKLEELLGLCDQLEAQLTTTETHSRRLLEAVLRDALAPAEEGRAALAAEPA